MDILVELDAINEYGGEDGYLCGEAAKLIRTLQSELARVQKERDAAIKDLHGLCDVCKHYTWPHNKGLCASCENDIRIGDEQRFDRWEWRGIKENNDG